MGESECGIMELTSNIHAGVIGTEQVRREAKERVGPARIVSLEELPESARKTVEALRQKREQAAKERVKSREARGRAGFFAALPPRLH
jgi:hypothetical protein